MEWVLENAFVNEVIANLVANGVLWATPFVLFALAYVARSLWRNSLLRFFDRAFGGKLWSRPVNSRTRKLQAQLAETRTPTLLIANHKGGVGKTTLALNFGAFMAQQRGRRVLFVDLDYQGSLSLTLRAMAGIEDVDFRAPQLFTDKVAKSGPSTRNIGRAMTGSAFVDSDEELRLLEEQLMMRWAVGVVWDDVRFRLLRFLLSEEVQRNFDLVVIDAPPRSTTAEINAIAAATHLLVPTKADLISARGAEKFLSEVHRLNRVLCPHLKLAGFVATMVRDKSVDVAASAAAHHLEAALQDLDRDNPGETRWERSVRRLARAATDKFVAHTYMRADVTVDAGQQPTVLRSSGEARQMLLTASEKIEAALKALGAEVE